MYGLFCVGLDLQTLNTSLAILDLHFNRLTYTNACLTNASELGEKALQGLCITSSMCKALSFDHGYLGLQNAQHLSAPGCTYESAQVLKHVQTTVCTHAVSERLLKTRKFQCRTNGMHAPIELQILLFVWNAVIGL